jgi:hypothetical protein
MTDNTTSNLTRERGMLTKTDRKYLRGNIEYDDKQQQRNRRRHIRQRVRNGIVDFNLLDMLEERDREQIFSEVGTSNIATSKVGSGKTELFVGMCAMVELLYKVSEENGISFEEIIENGIQDAEEDLTGRQLDQILLEKEFKNNETDPISSVDSTEIEMNLSGTEKKVMRRLLENMKKTLD